MARVAACAALRAVLEAVEGGDLDGGDVLAALLGGVPAPSARKGGVQRYRYGGEEAETSSVEPELAPFADPARYGPTIKVGPRPFWMAKEKPPALPPTPGDLAVAAACGATQTTGPEAEAPVDADASPVHSSGTSLEEPSRAEESRPTGLSGAVDSTPTPPLTSHAPAGEGTPSPPLPSPAGAPTRFSGESGEVLCRGCESPLIAEEVPAGVCMGCEEFMESIPKATDPPPVLSVLDEAALVALAPNLVARIVRGENAANASAAASVGGVVLDRARQPQDNASMREQIEAVIAKPKGAPRHRWSGVDPNTCSR